MCGGRRLSIARHLKALALIGREPGTAEHAKRELDEFDRKHLSRAKIPPSVREGYETPGAVELLREYSNQDAAPSSPDLTLSTRTRAEGAPIWLRLMGLPGGNPGAPRWRVARAGADN